MKSCLLYELSAAASLVGGFSVGVCRRNRLTPNFRMKGSCLYISFENKYRIVTIRETVDENSYVLFVLFYLSLGIKQSFKISVRRKILYAHTK